MTIQKIKECIMMILAERQGSDFSELYEIFVTEYARKKMDKKNNEDLFKEGLYELMAEDYVVESNSEKNDEKIYFSKQILTVEVPFLGIPTSCQKCRFKIKVTDNIEGINEYQTIKDNMQKNKHACLINPELQIYDEDEIWESCPLCE